MGSQNNRVCCEPIEGPEGAQEDDNDQSEFRADKDMQYPDDERNAPAAEGLTEMAAWSKLQHNDSPLMVRLATALDSLYADGSDYGSSFEPPITDRLSWFRLT